MTAQKVTLGITIGDINSIAPEIIIRTFSDDRILKQCNVVIYANAKVINYHKKLSKIQRFNFFEAQDITKLNSKVVNLINPWPKDLETIINLGTPSQHGGDLALQSMDRALADWKANMIDSIVTAPINKSYVQPKGFDFTGHTEYITQYVGMEDSLMFMIHERLKVGLVTNHIPVKEISAKLSIKQIVKKLHLMDTCLQTDFLIQKPKIAVLGLNPHAGDNGLIGKEETDCIVPAIKQAKDSGILAVGPFPADGFFGSDTFKHFDAVLAMYHDQGLAPFKALSFGQGVNFTAGLPIVRTSPDHGTAYDLAGKNQADAGSFRQAVFTAIDICTNRKLYTEMHENKLVRKDKNSRRR